MLAKSPPVLGGNQRVIRSGDWYGNDTAWRMCLDLNKILFYGGPDGRLSSAGRRTRYLALVDGIVAGEGNGPMNPDPVPAGLILGGANPVSVDCAAAVLMGFDPAKIPLLEGALRSVFYPLAAGAWENVQLASDLEPWNGRLGAIQPASCFKFRPHFGWKGHVEREPTDDSELKSHKADDCTMP